MLVTLTPPATGLLTTVAAAKVELGVSGSGDDERIGGLVAQASGMCARFADRVFGRGSYREGPADACAPLSLSRRPVVSVTSVTRCGDVLDPSSYQLDAESGLLLFPPFRDRAFYQGLIVTYEAGYLLPGQAGRDLPDDVERACLEVVKALWFSGGAAARDPALRSESVQGVGSTSWLDPQAASGGLPPLAATLLNPYRLFRF